MGTSSASQIGIRNRARVSGSGFTAFTWQGSPIAFVQQISHTSPQGVGSGPVAIQPMDEPYPTQVITPAASGMGTLVLRMYELYGAQVWERLGSSFTIPAGGTLDPRISERFDPITGKTDLGGAIDLVDIFIRIAASPDEIQVVKFIKPPPLRGALMRPYTQEFHNCVVTNVQDSEEVNVGSMEVVKDITVAYTYSTRNGIGSSAWALRDSQLNTSPLVTSALPNSTQFG